MRKLMLLIAILSSFAAAAAAETFNNAPVLDVACAKTSSSKTPDAHSRECALQCQKSGFGIVTSDNKFLKFDSQGNALVLDALKKTKKDYHLRVDVTGDVQGDTLKVTSLKLL